MKSAEVNGAKLEIHCSQLLPEPIMETHALALLKQSDTSMNSETMQYCIESGSIAESIDNVFYVQQKESSLSADHYNMYADHLKFNVSTWKRPEGPPHIWRVIEGRRKLGSGEIPRFSIQEVPKELENEVIKFMSTTFLLEESFSSNLGIADDPLAVQEFQTTWRNHVQQGITLVALKVQSDPAAKPVIAGANVLHVVTAEDAANAGNVTQYRSNGMKRVMRMMEKLAEEADVLRRYGVDKCLSALGLSVNPAFRGQGLGEELLRVRETIGRTYQIPVCGTVFSSKAAQILANRLGYDVLMEREFCELLDEEGKVAFPELTGFFQVTGKRLY